MSEDVTGGAVTLIPAEHDRYELINITYIIEESAGTKTIKVEATAGGPVIAWRIYQSRRLEGMVATPVGVGLTKGLPDSYHLDQEPEPKFNYAYAWRDKKENFWHTIDFRVPAGRDSEAKLRWAQICGNSIQMMCNSEYQVEEREGLPWHFPDPVEWTVAVS